MIELQAQFGNKWARIATYLPGRTDNDVKNFWSSRQKRLARILRTSAPQPAKPQNNNNNGSQNAVFQDSPPIEVTGTNFNLCNFDHFSICAYHPKDCISNLHGPCTQ